MEWDWHGPELLLFIVPPMLGWALWSLRQVIKGVAQQVGKNGGKSVHEVIEKIQTEQHSHAEHVAEDLGAIKGRLMDGDTRMDRLETSVQEIHHEVTECRVLRGGASQ